jgi:hypothetical protein
MDQQMIATTEAKSLCTELQISVDGPRRHGATAWRMRKLQEAKLLIRNSRIMARAEKGQRGEI